MLRATNVARTAKRSFARARPKRDTKPDLRAERQHAYDRITNTGRPRVQPARLPRRAQGLRRQEGAAGEVARGVPSGSGGDGGGVSERGGADGDGHGRAQRLTTGSGRPEGQHRRPKCRGGRRGTEVAVNGHQFNFERPTLCLHFLTGILVCVYMSVHAALRPATITRETAYSP